MDDLSFTTFLKLALMPTTPGKFGVLNRMLTTSGGYDFYKRMKLAAQAVAQGKTPAEDVLSKLKKIKKDAERQHNLLMARRFLTWWSGMHGAVALADRPKGIFRTPDMHFGVKLVPELAYQQEGSAYVTYLWATKMPRLTRQMAGVGLYMLRQELMSKVPGARFQILDLRQEVVFSEDCITNQTASLMAADIASINSIWASIALPKAA